MICITIYSFNSLVSPNDTENCYCKQDLFHREKQPFKKAITPFPDFLDIYIVCFDINWKPYTNGKAILQLFILFKNIQTDRLMTFNCTEQVNCVGECKDAICDSKVKCWWNIFAFTCQRKCFVRDNLSIEKSECARVTHCCTRSKSKHFRHNMSELIQCR